ncbi:MAG: endonuclease [Bryobacterales bacterium]|nr:endonuclease [Bryobacterales bacterium]
MSTSRTMLGGVADRAMLPRGPSGRVLCRWCNLEVPSGRFTFCSDWCVHEWRLRTDPGYLRDQVFARDHGICAICRVDCRAAYLDLKRARGVHRLKLLERWGLKRLNRRTLWDADHIVPVAEGGGECDLENIRSLCVICHRRQTSELRARLAARTSPNL